MIIYIYIYILKIINIKIYNLNESIHHMDFKYISWNVSIVVGETIKW